MAITENIYTGDGTTVLFSFTFPYLDETHIKVSLDGSDTTAYTLANATTIQLNSAPSVGVSVRIYRNSDEDSVESTFFPGAAIRAVDLNDNFLQSLYLNQETRRIAQDATTGAIADGSISSAKLGTAVVTEPKIASSAVTESKIGSGAVTETKLGAGAVTNTKIAAGAVDATQLATDAVTNAKIATAAVNTDELASSAVTTAKVADSAITQAKIGTNVLTPRVSEINGGPLAGFRNAIINGNFDIWQRGTSFTGNQYGADRWLHGRVGTTHTVSQQSFTLGQTDVPNEPTYFCRTVVSTVAAAGNYALLSQRIEDVRTFAGQQITISFWAKADATKNISVELEQYFGTGGSPSVTVSSLGVTKVSIGTSWQKVTVTTTLPSISTKTLGNDNNSLLNFSIWFDAGSTWNTRTDTLGQQSGTFDIAQVQVEAGPVATPFERRPIGTELALCQRYCWKPEYSSGHGQVGYGFCPSTTAVRAIIPTPVTMRAAPTIVGTILSKPDNATLTDIAIKVLANGIEIGAAKVAGTGGNSAAVIAILPGDNPSFSAEL